VEGHPLAAPEGTFPGGKPTCVGPDRENGMRKKGHQDIDI
jgi:hypothetical protein